MGSSKRLSHSSTARLLVMTKLAIQRRLSKSSYRSGGLLAGEPVEAQTGQDEQTLVISTCWEQRPSGALPELESL